jgi:hypothetical protein
MADASLNIKISGLEGEGTGGGRGKSKGPQPPELIDLESAEPGAQGAQQSRMMSQLVQTLMAPLGSIGRLIGTAYSVSQGEQAAAVTKISGKPMSGAPPIQGAGGAGAATAGAAGAGAAAGTLVGMGVIEGVKALVGFFKESSRQGGESVGRFSKELGILTKPMESAGKAAGFISPVLTRATNEISKTVRAFVDEMNRHVGELQNYSAEISQATARTLLREERTRFSRAARLGPRLAQFEDTRARAQEQLDRLQTEALSAMLTFFKMAEPGIETLLLMGQLFTQGVEVVNNISDTMMDVLNMNPIMKQYLVHLQAIREALTKEKKEEDPFFDMLLAPIAHDMAGGP